MGNEHLSHKPHQVTTDFWWYEENDGIKLYVRGYDEKGSQKNLYCNKITWKSLRAALSRKDKK